MGLSGRLSGAGATTGEARRCRQTDQRERSGLGNCDDRRENRVASGGLASCEVDVNERITRADQVDDALFSTKDVLLKPLGRNDQDIKDSCV